MTIQNARGKIFLTKERAVEHTSHAKKENPELALGVFQVCGFSPWSAIEFLFKEMR